MWLRLAPRRNLGWPSVVILDLAPSVDWTRLDAEMYSHDLASHFLGVRGGLLPCWEELFRRPEPPYIETGVRSSSGRAHGLRPRVG